MKRLAFLLIFFVFIACRNKDVSSVIDVSGTENLATSALWGIILDPYVAYKTKPAGTADVAGHGRRGDVVKVLGRHIEAAAKNRLLWYQFETGWLLEKNVQIYSNELKANYAASQLR